MIGGIMGNDATLQDTIRIAIEAGENPFEAVSLALAGLPLAA